MAKTALGGALLALCLLAARDCISSGIRDWAFGLDTNDAYPWLWDTSYLPAWFLFRVLPGAPLGAATVLSVHLWRKGRRQEAATLCKRKGFIATTVLGINTVLVLHTIYIDYLKVFTSYNSNGTVSIWYEAVWHNWLIEAFKHLCTYGAFQWSIGLWLAGLLLQKRAK